MLYRTPSGAAQVGEENAGQGRVWLSGSFYPPSFILATELLRRTQLYRSSRLRSVVSTFSATALPSQEYDETAASSEIRANGWAADLEGAGYCPRRLREGVHRSQSQV